MVEGGETNNNYSCMCSVKPSWLDSSNKGSVLKSKEFVLWDLCEVEATDSFWGKNKLLFVQRASWGVAFQKKKSATLTVK